MRTYPIIKDGNLYAFEISNLLVSPRSAAKLLSKNTSVKILKIGSFFDRKSDDRVIFEFDGIEYVVHEPYGDNSRYWIGPSDNNKQNSKIIEVHNIFLTYEFTLFRYLFGIFTQ